MTASGETYQFRWYLGGVASWFAGYGIQMIVFPWLVAVVLTVLGELFVALHPTTGAILLVIGALQLGLLLLPGLRQSLRERPVVPSH